MQLHRDPRLILGLILTSLVMITVIIGAVWSPYDPLHIAIDNRLAPPSTEHPLGTDQYGRDLLSRVMTAAPHAILTGIMATFLAAISGIPAGLIAAWRGKWYDEIVMRIVDALLSLPPILLVLLVVTMFGTSPMSTAIAIGISSAPVFARMTRSASLQVRSGEFITAARALGATDLTIITRHLLPNCAAPLFVQATQIMSTAIIVEASLSFLGAGRQPPLPSWGRMVAEAQPFLSLSPWPLIVPAVAIAITVLGLNMLGDALREAADPRLRS